MQKIEAIRAAAKKAKESIFALEQLVANDENDPNFDLRRRLYRARCEVGHVSFEVVQRDKHDREGT